MASAWWLEFPIKLLSPSVCWSAARWQLCAIFDPTGYQCQRSMHTRPARVIQRKRVHNHGNDWRDKSWRHLVRAQREGQDRSGTQACGARKSIVRSSIPSKWQSLTATKQPYTIRPRPDSTWLLRHCIRCTTVVHSRRGWAIISRASFLHPERSWGDFKQWRPLLLAVASGGRSAIEGLKVRLSKYSVALGHLS